MAGESAARKIETRTIGMARAQRLASACSARAQLVQPGGDGDRRAIVQKGTDHLHADRQALGGAIAMRPAT